MVILGWLILFAVLSTFMFETEVTFWLICSLKAVVLSYVIIDSLFVILFSVKCFNNKMSFFLALRAVNSEYLSSTLSKKIVISLEKQSLAPPENACQS